MNLNPPSERPICPMRPSGGPCVGHDDPGEGCAWWDVDECAILSLTKSIYAIEEVLREGQPEVQEEGLNLKGKVTIEGRPWVTGPGETLDDDVPF